MKNPQNVNNRSFVVYLQVFISTAPITFHKVCKKVKVEELYLFTDRCYCIIAWPKQANEDGAFLLSIFQARLPDSV